MYPGLWMDGILFGIVDEVKRQVVVAIRSILETARIWAGSEGGIKPPFQPAVGSILQQFLNNLITYGLYYIIAMPAFSKLLALPLLATTALAAPKLAKRFTFPIPGSTGSVTFDEPYEIAAGETYDGELQTFGRGVECTGQEEGGESDTVFIVQEGGTLRNAIIGSDQIEGVYCLGACTIENVWWEKVCEDALSLKEGSGPYNVIGGGAQGAEDKVIQVCLFLTLLFCMYTVLMWCSTTPRARSSSTASQSTTLASCTALAEPAVTSSGLQRSVT